MNIQSGQSRSARPAHTGTAVRLLPKMWFVTKAALFLVGGAMILNGHIYLRQKISETERGIRATERRITDTRRELEHLRIKYAEYTRWEHIQRKIAAFNLPLTPPQPGQVREIRLYTPEQSAKIAAALDASSHIAQR